MGQFKKIGEYQNWSNSQVVMEAVAHTGNGGGEAGRVRAACPGSWPELASLEASATPTSAKVNGLFLREARFPSIV